MQSVVNSQVLPVSLALTAWIGTLSNMAFAQQPVTVFVSHASAAQVEEAPDTSEVESPDEDGNLGLEEAEGDQPDLQRRSGSATESDEPRPMASVCPEDGIIIRRPISSISASILVTEKQQPEDCSTNVFQGRQMPAGRTADLVQFCWRPTNFFHQPLYFDDTPLERYGQSLCPLMQPVISGVRFFGTVPIVPYKMGIDRTHDCVSTLGYYRPGNCNPCIRERIMPALEGDAALLEAGVALALVFALP